MECKYIELQKGEKRPKTKFNILHNSCTTLQDAGLILPNDIVVVDFDKRPDIALKIIEKYKIKSVKTDRGYHLYFKYPKGLNINLKNTSKTITVLGCEVDYKTGNNNSNAYAIVKRNGIDREKLYFDNEIQELPLFLYPTKNKVNVSELSEGNRNSELFKHLSLVKRHYNNLSDFITLANTINSTLNEPLNKKEVETTAIQAYNGIDKEIKPYYQVDKDVFKLWIDKKISSLAFKIYVLMFDRNKITQFYDEQGRKYLVMSYVEIMKHTNMKKDTGIPSAINQLEEYGLIRTEKQTKKATKYYLSE